MASYETNKPKYKQSSKVNSLYKKMNSVSAKRPGKYSESSRVTDLYNEMKDFESTKLGEYQSRFSGKIDSTLDKILNREEFTYDMNADPLYQQYKQQYTQQGQQAMQDVMGNAASLTGGYGNSYASTVGSQAYQGYLGQLNDKALDLYQIAYQKYQDQGSNMYNQLGALQSVDDVGYSRYRDTVNDWYSDRDYKTGLYQNERNFDYGQYQDKWSQYNTDRDYATSLYQDERNYDYGKYTDRLSQWNTDRDYGYKKDYDAQQQANWSQEFAYQQQKDAEDRAYQYAALNNSSRNSSGSSSSGSKSSTRGGSYSPLSNKKISEYQNSINNMTPGQAKTWIKQKYESGELSESQATELTKYNDSTAAQRAINPMARRY